MWKIFVFVLGSILLASISWSSLRVRRSHGFYRFFAWECLLVLLLLNVEVWFNDPFAWNQIISWVLLVGALIPLGLGVHELRRRGQAVESREGDDALLPFERTTNLVTSGIYRYIRHPLYSSLLLLAWGIFFKSVSFPGFAVAAAATVLLVLTARADETECMAFFGPQYRRYMTSTRMFIPFLL
ncbi:MAG: methyltransferase [Dermatophilaceae bacterium]